MTEPVVIGIGGWSGAGKTALASALVGRLRSHGLRVACVKHAPKGFDVDRAGSDSARFTDAGADAVLVASAARLALFQRTQHEPSLRRLLAMLPSVDVVLVEGFHDEPIPRIELAVDGQPLRSDVRRLIAVVTHDGARRTPRVPYFGRDDVEGLAALIIARLDTGAENEAS